MSKNCWVLPECWACLNEPPKPICAANPPSFTLHHLQRQRFPRSKMVVGPSVDHTWQADLVEMQDPKLVQNNHCTRYLLTVIDVLSKYT